MIIASDAGSARSTIDEMMNQGRFGEAGRRVVVEEFLRGTECSLHALVDGVNYRLLERRVITSARWTATPGRIPAGWARSVRQTIGPLSSRMQFRQKNHAAAAGRSIMKRTLHFAASLSRFHDQRGWRARLEFNCRFGDPETQAILPRMKSDLLPLLEATIDGKIDNCSIEWDHVRR